MVPVFPQAFLKGARETPGNVTSTAPMLGKHTCEVLKRLLGKIDEEFDALEKQGAIVKWKG